MDQLDRASRFPSTRLLSSLEDETADGLICGYLQLITFMLAFVLLAGARSARSGNGFGGALTSDV